MIQRKNIFLKLIFIHLFCWNSIEHSFGQNNALILNGAFININNGSWASPVYLVVNNGQPAAILRNSGHIISEKEGNYVQWNTDDVTVATNYTIPFGYSNSDYLPVSIHKNSIGSGAGHTNNSSAMAVSTWSTPADNTSVGNSVTSMIGYNGGNATNAVIDRWWQVLSCTNVSSTFDVTYRGFENTTAAPLGVFNAQQWDAVTAAWMASSGSGTGVTIGTGSVTNINLIPHGLSTSSPYILSTSATPLPIELISFTANCTDNQIHIKWTNATETDVMNIELQKSYDLNSWTTIYTASPSNQNINTYYNYEYTETNNQVIYYRLKTNNNDGGFDLGAVIYMQPCESISEILTAYSDGSTIHVHTDFENTAIVNYALFDVQGKKSCNWHIYSQRW